MGYHLEPGCYTMKSCAIAVLLVGGVRPGGCIDARPTTHPSNPCAGTYGLGSDVPLPPSQLGNLASAIAQKMGVADVGVLEACADVIEWHAYTRPVGANVAGHPDQVSANVHASAACTQAPTRGASMHRRRPTTHTPTVHSLMAATATATATVRHGLQVMYATAASSFSVVSATCQGLHTPSKQIRCLHVLHRITAVLCHCYPFRERCDKQPDASHFVDEAAGFRAHFTTEAMASFLNASAARTIPEASSVGSPLFVVGMLRSGSTLLEAMLDAHSQVAGLGEVSHLLGGLARYVHEQGGGSRTPHPRVARPETLRTLTEGGAELAAQLRALYEGRVLQGGAGADARWYVDKSNHNFLHLWMIQHMFPGRGARVIHCVRDAMDTGLSIFKQGFVAHWARDLGSIGRVLRAERDLMAHWAQTLDVPVLEVRYEALVFDPAHELQRIASFLGVGYERQMLDFWRAPAAGTLTANPSAAQVRRPLYTTSVGASWRYATHLGALAAALDQADQGAVGAASDSLVLQADHDNIEDRLSNTRAAAQASPRDLTARLRLGVHLLEADEMVEGTATLLDCVGRVDDRAGVYGIVKRVVARRRTVLMRQASNAISRATKEVLRNVQLALVLQAVTCNSDVVYAGMELLTFPSSCVHD